MRWSPRAIRIGVVASLVIPAIVILLTSSLQAQVRPPFPKQLPFPPITQPKMPTMERVWTCGKCNKVIGNGAFPPGNCPHCGVRIINGVGGPNPNINPNPPVNPNPNPVFIPNPNPPVNPNPNPPLNPNPVFNPNPPPVNDLQPAPVLAPPPAAAESQPQVAVEERRPSRTGLIAGILFGGVLFVGAVLMAVGVVVYFTAVRAK